MTEEREKEIKRNYAIVDGHIYFSEWLKYNKENPEIPALKDSIASCKNTMKSPEEIIYCEKGATEDYNNKIERKKKGLE